MEVTWYFDFISPFAYFQAEQLRRLPASTRLRPVLLAGLLNHWGHKGPAEIPAKRRFTYRHALWIARQQGLAFRAPPAHPFNPLGALRLAIALDCDPDAVLAIFRFIWGEGHRPDDPDAWQQLIARLDAGDAAERIGSDAVKTALRGNTDQAIAQGVFGVPTIAVGDTLFWGYDALAMALAYLDDPTGFEDKEMRRMDRLPIGVERRH